MSILLKEIIEDKDTCIFLGAGSSSGSGLPLGDSGARTIIRLAFSALGMKATWNKLNEMPQNNLSIRWPRFEVLLQILSEYRNDAAPKIVDTFRDCGISATHQILANYSSQPRLWLTTNFDDQIEKSLKASGHLTRAIVDRQQISSLRRSNLSHHLVVKLHGDSNTEDIERDLGIRLEQILRTFPRATAKALIKIARDRPLLIIGYSARDPDLFFLLENLIANASAVVWIGHGNMDVGISRLQNKYPIIQYLDGGSPIELDTALAIKAPMPIKSKLTWEQRIAKVLKQFRKHEIIQTLAEICLERNDQKSRQAIADLHSLMSGNNDLQIVDKLRREVEVALRAGIATELLHDQFTIALTKLAEDESRILTARLIAYNALFEIAFRTESYHEAAKIAERGSLLANRAGKLRQVLTFTINLGISKAYQGADNLEQGKKILMDVVKLARNESLPLHEIDATTKLSVALMRANLTKDAEQLLSKTRMLIDEIGNPRRHIGWNVNMAESLRYQTRFEEAAIINSEALEIAETLDDTEAIGIILTNCGLCFIHSGKVREAELAFARAINIAQSCKGEMMPNNIYNRGWIRLLLGLWDEAAEWFAKSADIFTKMSANERAVSSLARQAWCRIRLGDYQNARRIYRSIIEQFNIPIGDDFRHNFKLLESAIKYPPDHASNEEIEQVLTILSDAPEQQFLYLFAVLENRSEVASDIYELAAEAARKTKIPLLESILNNARFVNKIAIQNATATGAIQTLDDYRNELIYD